MDVDVSNLSGNFLLILNFWNIHNPTILGLVTAVIFYAAYTIKNSDFCLIKSQIDRLHSILSVSASRITGTGQQTDVQYACVELFSSADVYVVIS